MIYNTTKDKPSKLATRIGKKIDMDLFLECLLIQTNSKDESRMSQFITDKLTELNIPYEVDEIGNIIATKGKADLYPVLACHQDTVHDLVENFMIFENQDILFAMDGKDTSQTGIGGDDKVGVFIAFQCLINLEACKAVFFTREEIGCYGSNRVNLDWFKDASFIGQVDRKGATDFVTCATGTVLCSNEFKTAISAYLDKWGYLDYTQGGLTDVVQLTENGVGVSTFNMSCGYYDPHSDNETIKVSDVQATWGLIYDLFTNINNTKWTHTVPKRVYNTYTKTTTNVTSYNTTTNVYHEITNESYEFIERKNKKNTGESWWSIPVHSCQDCGEGLYSDETPEDGWWCFGCNGYKIINGVKVK
jgi:hypothetical protein